MTEQPLRYRSLKSDAIIRNAIDRIERDLNLPRGSVRFVKPDGKVMNSGKTVNDLREAWEDD